MQMLHVEAIGDGRAAQFIGLADTRAALDSAAGHPHRESIRVVIAASALGILRRGLASKFAAPDDQRLIQ